MPAMTPRKGFRPILLLSDFRNGKGLSLSIWNSEADAVATEQNGLYQAQVDKFQGLMAGKPVREAYLVTVQE
jgi:hypothetical protein